MRRPRWTCKDPGVAKVQKEPLALDGHEVTVTNLERILKRSVNGRRRSR